MLQPLPERVGLLFVFPGLDVFLRINGTARIATDAALLDRLAEGRYGTCIRCADPISVVRLEARPWATRCIRCADRVGW